MKVININNRTLYNRISCMEKKDSTFLLLKVIIKILKYDIAGNNIFIEKEKNRL